jgi:hypothetical protein
MMLRIGSALVVCVVCTAFACTPVSPPQSPSSMTVTGADEGPRAAQQDPPAAPASLAEPVRARVEHCRSTAGGKLVVRVQRTAPNGKLAFDLAPSSSLDPLEKKCVLDALSKLDIDESSTAWAGLNVPPTGFTSLLTVEW